MPLFLGIPLESSLFFPLIPKGEATKSTFLLRKLHTQYADFLSVEGALLFFDRLCWKRKQYVLSTRL